MPSMIKEIEILHVNYKISGIQNKNVALLTLHGACTKTMATRRKSFLAAKSTEVELNTQLNEDSLILSVGQCSWKKKKTVTKE